MHRPTVGRLGTKSLDFLDAMEGVRMTDVGIRSPKSPFVHALGSGLSVLPAFAMLGPYKKAHF